MEYSVATDEVTSAVTPLSNVEPLVQHFRTCHMISYHLKLTIQNLYSSSDSCQTDQVWHFAKDVILVYPYKWCTCPTSTELL